MNIKPYANIYLIYINWIDEPFIIEKYRTNSKKKSKEEAEIVRKNIQLYDAI